MIYDIYIPCLNKRIKYKFANGPNDCNPEFKYFTPENCVFLTPYRLVETDKDVEDCSVDIRSPEEACGEIQELKYRDMCYYNIASYYEGDKEEICDKISLNSKLYERSNKTIRNECYINHISPKDKTSETCTKISEQPYKDYCYLSVSKVDSNPELCINIEDEKRKESCYGQFKSYKNKMAS